MDLKQFAQKPVHLKLRSGRALTGSIQAWTDDGRLLFLTSEKGAQLNREHGGASAVALPIEKALAYLDVLAPEEVATVVPIETEVASLHTVTESGKLVGIDGFRVELRGCSQPGHVGARYRAPENDKWFDLGELQIEDATVRLPIHLAFVSYAKEDQSQVIGITRSLNDYGVVTWFDKRMLLPGDDWKAKIESAIEDADYFLLFLSSRTMDRVGYKNREMRVALAQQMERPMGKRFIVPILLDECDPPRELREFHWLRVYEGQWLESLVRAVAPPVGLRELYGPAR